jgi:hypothetical protein
LGDMVRDRGVGLGGRPRRSRHELNGVASSVKPGARGATVIHPSG